MNKVTETLVLVCLCLIAPLVFIIPANLLRWFSSGSFEPMVDNLITYMALLPVFGVAAITSGAYRLFRHVHDDIDGNILAYATAGALGSGLILLIADVLDEYFTPGFSGIWMAFGLVAGSAFGAIYALLCNRLQRS